MDGVIEALHIYDEHNAPVLSHVYTGRPLSATQLLPLYLDQQRQQSSSSSSSAFASASSAVGALPNASSSLFASSRRQPASLVYVPDTNPPTLVFSIVHASLLFLLTTSSELEPLLALEFLHRVADALEEFLGSPLIAGKIESNYDVVAQLLTEMCDAGTVGTTEPNALHDLVEMEGLMDKLLGSITLPGKAAAALSSAASQAAASSLGSSFAPSSSSLSSSSSSPAALLAASQRSNSPALPWRRANVRHTSNEMYADVVESLSVTLAPSGRPLAAFAQGSIAFNSKVSGMPDILLTMSGPAGKHNLGSIIELPVFHPCVRLARWKERPGELSFIPPDGRFILAAYEVDLMPYRASSAGSAAFSAGSHNTASLKMPVSVEMRTNLGPTGTEFEVRASVNRTFAFGRSNGASASGSSLGGGGLGLGGPHAGSSGAPSLEDLRISVPLPADVRNLLEIRPTRGDAVYSPGEHLLEWHIPAKEVANGATFFGLRCTVVGQHRPQHGDVDGDSDNSDFENGGAGGDEYGFARSGGGLGFKEYTYDEPYQQPASPASPASPGEKSKKKKKKKKKGSSKSKSRGDDIDDEAAAAAAAEAAAAESAAEAAAEAAAKRRIARSKTLMPSSASVSFSVKGWLASGVRIESIVLDTKRSRGLGEGIKPFKGVKYVTVSKGGIELRC